MSVAIRTALADRLNEIAALTALVGNRIRPVTLFDKDAYPGVTYRLQSLGTEPGIDESDSMPAPRFEIIAWSTSHLQAAELADLIYRELEDADGDWTPGAGSVAVEAVTLLEMEDVMAEDSDGNGRPVFGCRCVYEIRFSEE